MIILDKKSYDLLSYLLSHDVPETVMAISKKLNQSRRKVYYHLEKINEALPSDVEKIEAYPRIGVVLNEEQRNACRILINELDDYFYVMHVEERIELNLVYIAVSKERVTIDKLMQLSDVSRNTVLNDLSEIRNKLSTEEYDIQLHVTKARGYYLKCHPLSKIQFLYRLLYNIYTNGNQSFVDIVKERMVDIEGFERYFSDEVNDYLQEYLASAQEILGKKLNSQDAHFMIQILPYLILSYRSIELSSEEQSAINREFSMTWQRREYVLANQISCGLSQNFDIELDKVEVSLIAMLLLSFRKDSDSHLKSRDYAEMRATLVEFLNVVQKEHGLIFNHENNLLDQLLTHCKAMLYRKTYGVLSLNPLTKYIKAKYSDLFEITKSCIWILEDAWLIHMTDDDIAYISIHLGGEIQKKKKAIGIRKHITLICDDGIGVQKLLLSQCKNYLPNCDIEAVFTSEQFCSVSDIIQTDMIISTSDMIDSHFPIIVVHPILDNDDIIKLIRFSKNYEEESESHFGKELEKCLKSYVPDPKERFVLKVQIERILNQELTIADTEN